MFMSKWSGYSRELEIFLSIKIFKIIDAWQ